MRRRDLIAGASAFGLAGCVTVAPPSLPPGALQERRRIGVVTAFDPQLELTFSGITVFDSLPKTVTVDWPLNAQSLALARRLLEPHHTLVEVQLDPAAIVETQRPVGFRTPETRLGDLLRARVTPGAVDALVLVMTASVKAQDFPIVGSGQTMPYGLRVTGRIARSEQGGLTAQSAFAVAYKAVVIDGRTLDPLVAVAPTQMMQTLYWRWNVETLPLVRLDFTWRGQEWTEMPLEQRETLRLAATSLVEGSLPKALARTGLLPGPAGA
ncbi:hypothetical protein [Elioraea sp.]|uniref:hypothetical protein n=1 Tax=Elioraea sp. TaxID=2185103 RepID=UPI0025BBD401|nr:hypothetical protein [Elioraea sp.]